MKIWANPQEMRVSSLLVRKGFMEEFNLCSDFFKQKPATVSKEFDIRNFRHVLQNIDTFLSIIEIH